MELAKRILVAAVMSGLSFFVSAGVIEAAINERLAPPGHVCVEGNECAAATAFSASTGVSSEPRSGETVYNNACLACHGTGAAGAPKLGDVADWSARLGQGIDTVYANAIGGVKAMPAMGLCMDCSNDEVKAAVDYMIENSK